ncbi:MAG TPA: flagellar hook-associated protein FlgK, partial [Nevskiaceae bacterium]|nr:flagellar hook-associated protein FlgK [Nevskiaceae bacterium]
MSDLLNIGTSALLAYRSALDTISHNIANANTDGYSRQRVDLEARPPQVAGNGYVGSGVQVQTTSRVSDSLVNQRLVADNSSYSRLDTFQQMAARADDLLSNSDTGLATPLQNFFSAMDGVAAAPASTAARQTLLSSADTLAGRFGDLSNQLSGMESDINGQLSTAVDQINQLAGSIAQLNDRIASGAGSANGNPPNDLLDQRDSLIKQLSSQIGVSTVTKTDGSVDVFAAGGQALVLGSR